MTPAASIYNLFLRRVTGSHLAVWFVTLCLSMGGLNRLHAAAPIGNFTTATANTSGSTPSVDETIPLQVTATQVSPASLTIESYVPGTFTISRKDPYSTSWGTPVATGVSLSAGGTWTDSNVNVGQMYEYQFVNTAGAPTENDYPYNIYPTGYILCGVQVDQTQPKGMMAVVCANDLPGNMPAQYAQYKADLMDDGWQVREIQVPRCPDNYTGLGNAALATVNVTNGGTTSIVTGSPVRLTDTTTSTPKVAIGTVTVNTSGTITAVSSSVTIGGVTVWGNAGSGFNVNDNLTLSGGELTTGTQAYVTANVTATNASLSSGSPIVGGTGYTAGQTVTLTGQNTGKTAQATFQVNASGAITYFTITSSQTGFTLYEPLTMSGNTTGSGIGTLLAYVPSTGTSAGQVTYVYIYGVDSGYTQGEAGTLTDAGGHTAQITLDVYNGHIDYAVVVSSQTGFVSGETLTLSGTATGTNAPLFSANVSATGPIQSVTVGTGSNAGTGYVNGALVQIVGGSTPAQGNLSVTSGAITGITITSGGSGFSQGQYLTLQPVTTVAPTLSVKTINNSNLGSAVKISSGGSGYKDNDTVTITGLSSGATAVGSLIAPSGTITGVSVVLGNTGAPGTFTTGEPLTITPTQGGSGVSATVDVPTDNHLAIRKAIQAIYTAYPGQLKNVVMVGKVPVCRTGVTDGAGVDGHGNECPYGADAFYAEMLGVVGVDWTDTQDNSIDVDLTDYNLPGDNQFDQQDITDISTNGDGQVQLGYGRIDLAQNIQTEIPAEINYFNKLHLYKINDPSFQPGRYACDRLGGFPGIRETDLQAMPGVIGMQNVAFIGTTALPVVNADQDSDQLYSTQNGPFLFYFKGSGGPGPGKNGKAVFWTGFQSHWGYWYQYSLASSGSNDMQLRLAENSFTLDFNWNGWGMRYIYHRMGMGLDAGDMMKTSINNQGFTTGPYTFDFNNQFNPGDFQGVLFMDQMGDPALRLFMFAPPTNLSVVGTTGNPVLNWTASTEPTVTGYHVYRAPYANAPFTRLTTTPVTGTTYTDTTASSGSSYVYMVRAIRLETTGGGTYYNASLGTTQSFTLGASPTTVTIQTTSIPTQPWETATTIPLVASGGVPQYTWSLTQGSLPAGLNLSPLGTISGTATAVGSFNFKVQAADQIGQTASQTLNITVNSDTSTVLYPIQTSWTNSGAATTSYGTYEYNSVSGPAGTNETFQQYDLSGVNLYNGFQKAILNVYVTSGTAATGIFAPIQANLLTDAVDGWTANGISEPFSGVSSGGTGKTLVNCPNNVLANGTLVAIAGLTGSGAPSTGPYAITIVDANDFTIPVTYGSWSYDPALAFVTAASLTYNTRPTAYDTNVPVLTATGTDTPGTWIQMDVTPYVQEVIANGFAKFPSKKMGLRLFTGTIQTVELGSLNSFGNTVPYITIQTTNAPNITVVSPTQNPASINLGSSIYLNTTVTALPARAANLTLQWSLVSGPGTAAFTSPTSASTGVSFSSAGQYVVQLAANDGVAQSYQNFTINVLSVPLGGPTDSMALRLPFDETSGTTAYDQSGNSNNGVFGTNGATWSSAGKIGGAVLLAGSNQQVDVSDPTNNPAPLDGQANMTFSFWFNPTAVDTDSSTRALLNKTGAYNFEVRNTAIYVTFTTAGILQELNSSAITAGKWYHLAVVFNGSTKTQQAYVNGYLISSSSVSGSAVLRKGNVPLIIGGISTTDAHAFNGMIDEVRIYDRVLTLAEIQSLAAATPSNLGPVITTNSSLTGSVGSPVTLSATVADNDPVGGTLTYNWGQTSGPATLTIASPTSISTTTTPSQPGTYGLQFMANDGIITTFANVGATITGQTYSSWVASKNLTGANALQTAIIATDGLNNLFKYAFGLNPTTNYNPGAAGLPFVQLNSSNYLSITFDGVATDVTYKVQATSNLTGSWTTIQTFASGGAAPGVQTVQDTQTTSASNQRYMRVVVTIP